MSLRILSRIYFYFFWFLLLAFLLTFQNTIWPFFLGSIPSPNLFLNSLILLSLLVNKPSIFAFILASLVYSVGSSFGFGFYLAPFLLLYLALLFIRSQTFFLNERSLFWVVLGSHFLVYFATESVFVLSTKKPWSFPFFDLVLVISLSAFCFPFQRHAFRIMLHSWRNTKWGEVGHE